MLFGQRKRLVNIVTLCSHIFQNQEIFLKELTDEILAFSECFADNDMM